MPSRSAQLDESLQATRQDAWLVSFHEAVQNMLMPVSMYELQFFTLLLTS